jgi:hypothetical protein
LSSLRSDLGRPETESFDLTGGKTLEHDVGLTNETAYKGQPVGGRHIGHDASLRRIEPFEEGTGSGWFITHSGRPPSSEGVPRGALHLDRVRASIDEQLGTVRSRNTAGQVEQAKTLKRHCHLRLHPFGWIGAYDV